jgi:hypothetical protein
LFGTACGSDDPAESSSPPAANASSAPGDQQQEQNGTGKAPKGGQSTDQQSGGNGQGAYSAAFAQCMRAHGFPKFPEPNGSGSELGPGSGVDMMSKEFQSAVNGPCKAQAPKAWTQSGPGTGS